MPDEPLRTLIDGMRARLHDELEVQLAAMAESHARDVEQARQAARKEADQQWGAQLEAARLEWNTRLQAEVASVRTESERALIAETMRARVQAEQAAAESTSTARRELEESFAAERRRLEEQLESERRRAAGLEGDRDRLAGELEAVQRRIAELETSREREASERQREAAAQEAERGKAQAALEAERDAHRRAFDTERDRLAAELEAQRRRVSELEAGQRRHAEELEAERRLVVSLKADVERIEKDLASERESARSVREAAPAVHEAPPAPAPAAPVPAAARRDDLPRLAAALRAMDQASTLTELLAAALKAAAAEAPRAALFLVQGTELREWSVDGVPSVDAGPLRTAGREAGVIADALRRHEPVATGAEEEHGAPFFATLPRDGVALAVPLVLNGTPVAVLYADQGTDGTQGEAVWRDAVQVIGRHAAACASALTALRTAEALRYVSNDRVAAPAAVGNGDDLQAARRYAKLLVSEIKLYNEQAVRLGREHGDLLLRLEPEIDRARRLYEERIPASVPDRHLLFRQELAQTLADGDHTRLGSLPQHRQS